MTKTNDGVVLSLTKNRDELLHRIQVLASEISDAADNCSALETQKAFLLQRSANIAAQRQRLALESANAEEMSQRQEQEASMAFGAERAAISRRLNEGLSIIRTFDDMLDSSVRRPTQSEIKASRAGVHTWLAGLNLENYIQGFESQGFVDLESTCEVEEDDLTAMGITGGNRRKVLAAAADLRAAMQEMPVSFAPQVRDESIARLKEALAEYRRWAKDFLATVGAAPTEVSKAFAAAV